MIIWVAIEEKLIEERSRLILKAKIGEKAKGEAGMTAAAPNFYSLT